MDIVKILLLQYTSFFGVRRHDAAFTPGGTTPAKEQYSSSRHRDAAIQSGVLPPHSKKTKYPLITPFFETHLQKLALYS